MLVASFSCLPHRVPYISGALDGGVSMSHVDLGKQQNIVANYLLCVIYGSIIVEIQSVILQIQSVILQIQSVFLQIQPVMVQSQSVILQIQSVYFELLQTTSLCFLVQV